MTAGGAAGRLPSRVLFVADGSLADGDLSALVARAASAGLTFMELRRPEWSGPRPSTGPALAEVERCLAGARGATVLINDRVDLALASGAAGVHVGQTDLPPEHARELLGPDPLIGFSTHDREQLERAQDLPVDYVALGPLFESPTKSGHARTLGLEVLRACCAWSRRPVVAIGGITADSLPSVLDAGAAAVALASGIGREPLERNAERVLTAVARWQEAGS